MPFYEYAIVEQQPFPERDGIYEMRSIFLKRATITVHLVRNTGGSPLLAQFLPKSPG